MLEAMDENPPRRSQSIFFIELDRIRPNPLQPRREFDEIKLKELAESIRQYGVLQPLVVVREEKTIPTGVTTEYELISGERRLRAARIAGLPEVPVIIREEPADKVKLELAIVENVQREDLNPLDKAAAFKKLQEEFNLTQKEIGGRIGKSREYVSNAIRLLSLSSAIQQALRSGLVSEGHARSLLVLADQPQEQEVLFNDIVTRQLNVREAERISRRVTRGHSYERAAVDTELKSIEDRLREMLGTRVSIEKKAQGGRVSIDFFSDEELYGLLTRFALERPAPLQATITRAPLLPETQSPDAYEAAASEAEREEFTI